MVRIRSGQAPTTASQDPLISRKIIRTIPDFTVDQYYGRLRGMLDHIERDGAFNSTMSRTLFELREPSIRQQTRQTNGVRFHVVPQLPGPVSSLRRQAQLVTVGDGHTPLISEAPHLPRALDWWLDEETIHDELDHIAPRIQDLDLLQPDWRRVRQSHSKWTEQLGKEQLEHVTLESN